MDDEYLNSVARDIHHLHQQTDPVELAHKLRDFMMTHGGLGHDHATEVVNHMFEHGLPEHLAAGGTAHKRKLSPLGLYSHGAEAAAALPQAKGSPDQMLATLKGVKKEELEGVANKLAGQKSVTRDELVKHFEDSMPVVEERIIPGEDPASALSRYGDRTEIVLPGGENYRELLLKHPHEEMKRVGVLSNGTIMSEEELSNPIVRRTAEKIGLTMEDRMMPTMVPFKSDHWTDPNVLAHLRMSDRTGPNGEKILHLEEVQSDWGQEGRDKGFFDPVAHQKWQEKRDEASKRVDEAKASHDRLMKEIAPEMNTARMPGESPRAWEDRMQDEYEKRHAFLNAHPEWKKSVERVINAGNDLAKIGQSPTPRDGVPIGPYVGKTEGWTDLALKRALKEAAEGGYDKIVWTPGKKQASRYDLSTHVHQVAYDPDEHELRYIPKGGKNWVTHDDPVEPEDLHKAIGKDVAKKLLEVPRRGGFHTLEGKDLSVGGKGMETYYDKMLPTRMQELARRHDKNAKVQPEVIPNSNDFNERRRSIPAEDIMNWHPAARDLPPEQQNAWWAGQPNWARQQLMKDYRAEMSDDVVGHGINITPQMRESILKGQAAFARGGDVESYKDPQSIISDWQWRPLSDVHSELGGMSEIPSHVQKFGDFMDETARRASTHGLTARDLVKAYAITLASIQRRAAPVETIRKAGLELPGLTGKIRPEGAMGEWLHTPAGQSYLDAASRRQIHEQAIEDMAQKLTPYGLTNKLADSLRWGAANLPGKEGLVSQLVAAGREKASTPDEWRDFAKTLPGIDVSKAGFIASMMGRGDQPTFDARQRIIQTGMSSGDAGAMIRGPKMNPKARAAVDRLASRQAALNLQLPERLSPYYQHLAHHAIWDKASNEETTHQDLINAMQHAATGGAIHDHPMAIILHALRPNGGENAYATGGKVSYNLKPDDKDRKHSGYQKTGGKMSWMSPDKFLSQTQKMDMDHDDKKSIKRFEKKMEKGKELNPLAIFPSGGQDGRHRAAAAKHEGIKKVPVITWPNKSKGGAIVKRALMITSKKA